METAEKCIVLGALFILAWIDVKKMELSVPLLALTGAAGILFQLGTNHLTWESVLGGAMIGGAILLVAAISRENIGMGDGLLFCATGACLGFRENLQLFMFASFCAAAVSLVLIRRKKYTRRSRIPFAPFVLAADVLLVAVH